MSNTTKLTAAKTEQEAAMQAYYHFHAKIYDLTRWSFLFGRKEIVRQLAGNGTKPQKILEVGCGTGYNTRLLAKSFPTTQLIGLDVSGNMLEKARSNTRDLGNQVQFINQPYTFGESPYEDQLDVILFSYSLTMINPQWESLIVQASKDLKAGGLIAVVDFHNSPFRWFKTHMQHNHVRMDSHLLPVLNRRFVSVHERVQPVYGGLWKYFTYMGMKAY